MTLNELFKLLASVLLDPKVIGITVVLAIYVNIVMYVVHYRKRVPKPKQKRVRPAPQASAAEGEGDGEGEPSESPKEKKSAKKGKKGAAEESGEDEEPVE